MYNLLPQFENNAGASSRLPEMLCCFKWIRIVFYVLTLITFLGIASAIFEFNVLEKGNLLVKITCFAVFATVGFGIYGIALAFCLETAFKRMELGETTPQTGNGNGNRSINYRGNGA